MNINVGRSFTAAVPIHIRLCRESDLLNLEWYGAYAEHRSIIASTFDRQRTGAAEMILAIARDFPVGQVWIDFERYASRRVALLWALRVMDPFQGRGIARRLVRAATALARRRGFTAAEIEAEREHPQIGHLYQRMGFSMVGERYVSWRYVAPDGDEIDRPLTLIVFRRWLVPVKAAAVSTAR